MYDLDIFASANEVGVEAGRKTVKPAVNELLIAFRPRSSYFHFRFFAVQECGPAKRYAPTLSISK